MGSIATQLNKTSVKWLHFVPTQIFNNRSEGEFRSVYRNIRYFIDNIDNMKRLHK